MIVPKMKRLFGVVLVTLVLGTGTFRTTPAKADTANLAGRVIAMVAIAAGMGYTCRVGSDPVYLSRGRYISVDTTLYRGLKYEIMGIGDEDVYRLNVTVLDGFGNLVGESEKRMPEVVFDVARSGIFQYQLMVTSGAGMATALVCYEN